MSDLCITSSSFAKYCGSKSVLLPPNSYKFCRIIISNNLTKLYWGSRGDDTGCRWFNTILSNSLALQSDPIWYQMTLPNLRCSTNQTMLLVRLFLFICAAISYPQPCPHIAHEESSINAVLLCSTTSLSKSTAPAHSHGSHDQKHGIVSEFCTDQHMMPVFQKGKGGASTIQYDIPYKYLISY